MSSVDPTTNPATSITAGDSSIIPNTNPYDDPLFISHNENVGASLVTQRLAGPNNFITWKISMEMALAGKMKLNFIKGKVPRPDEESPQRERWDRCNAVVMTWILNSVSQEIGESHIHSRCCIQAWSELQLLFGTSNDVALFNLRRDISSLTQGDMNISTYYGKLKRFWGDEDFLDEFELCEMGRACKSSQAMAEKKVRDIIIQFLMGLNDHYVPVRTQILSMVPRPKIEQVYGMLIQEEDCQVQ